MATDAGNFIDLTRQSSFDTNEIQQYIERYINLQLFAQHIGTPPTSPFTQRKGQAQSNEDAESAKETLEFLRNSFNQISNSKMKLLIHENSSFMTILLQNLSFYKYNLLVSSPTINSKRVEEFNLTLECFHSIFNSLENYLFLIIPQSTKELLSEFSSMLSLCLSYVHDTFVKNKPPAGSNALDHCKTFIFLFRMITLCLVILHDNNPTDEDLDDQNSPTSLIHLKEKYYEQISQILTILSTISFSELYGRTFALSLQKYFFKLISIIISDLHLYIVKEIYSDTLKTRKTILHELRNLPSIQEYNKLLTVCCFHEHILFHANIIQFLLKCHAALCSYLLVAVVTRNSPPIVGKNDSLKSPAKPTGGGSLSSKDTPTKSSLLEYFPQMKNDSAPLQMKIKKRNFEEFSDEKSSNSKGTTSSAASAAHSFEILRKLEEVSMTLLELFDIEHDLMSAFLFQLYKSLLQSLTTTDLTTENRNSLSKNHQTTVWNYNYSTKSFSNFITILIPIMLIHHESLRKVSRFLLMILFVHSSWSSSSSSSIPLTTTQLTLLGIPMTNSLETLTQKDSPSLVKIFSIYSQMLKIVNNQNNSSLSSSSSQFNFKISQFSCFMHGIFCILTDENIANTYLSNQNQHSIDLTISQQELDLKKRKLILTQCFEILECLLSFYNGYQSFSLTPFFQNQFPSDEKEEYSNFEEKFLEILNILSSWKYSPSSSSTSSSSLNSLYSLMIQALKYGLDKIKEFIPIDVLNKSNSSITAAKSLITQQKQKITEQQQKLRGEYVIQEDIDDVFAALEEEEHSKNPHHLSDEQLKKRQRVYGIDQEEPLKEEWISAREPGKRFLPGYYEKQQQQQQQQMKNVAPKDPLASIGAGQQQQHSSLLAKAGVTSDQEWARQKELLKLEKENARKKFLADKQQEEAAAKKRKAAENVQDSLISSPFALKRQFSSSFITMDENPFDKKGSGNEEDEEDLAIPKQPLVLLNIHEYMKASNDKAANKDDASSGLKKKASLTTEELNMLEAKRIMDMVNRDVYFQQKNLYADEKIGDSILSVSIDPICKEILNFHLSKLLKEQMIEDEKRHLQYQQTYNPNVVNNNQKKPAATGVMEKEEGEESEHDEEEQKKGELIPTEQPLPVRFNTTDQYINSFQPLLIEEFKAALIAVLLNEDGNNSSNYHSQQRYQSIDEGKEFREIYYQNELLVVKPNDSDLMEAQISIDYQHYDATMGSGGGGGGNNNNNNKGNNAPNYNSRQLHQYELQKDELVLIFKNTFPKGVKTRKELVKHKHFIGIITNASKKKIDQTTQSTNHFTVLIRKHPEFIPKMKWIIVPIMNLSTFLREWTALLSINNPTLVPLSSYLMNGSPVCSPTIINNISEKIQKKLRNIEKMRMLHEKHLSLSKTNPTAAATSLKTAGIPSIEHLENEIFKLENSLLSEMQELKELKVDPSILKSTGIAKLLVNLVKKCKKDVPAPPAPAPSSVVLSASMEVIEAEQPAPPQQHFVEIAEQLIDKWRILVREYSNAETIKNLKGGKIIKIPSLSEITIPMGLSPKLWKTLTERYNESQLFAIKHVVNQFEKQQDTRIALIQGPPGTGKTSTIIGIISALLNHGGFGVTTNHHHHNNKSSSSSSTSSSSMMKNSSDQYSYQNQRLLICAPSNAAIDEILTRLALQGIYNEDGQLIANQSLKIVRLGEPPSIAAMNNHNHNAAASTGYSPLIHSLTLESQIEKKLQKEDLYLKSLQLQETLSSIEKEFLEIQSIIRLSKFNNTTNQGQLKIYEEKSKNLKYQLFEIRNTKILYEISLERLKSQFRQDLLLQANIVGTTLSSSGKQHFLDYIIKENVFFTTTIIDEAAQTTEPSTLIPLRFGCKRLVLVGDPRQLPATVLSRKAERLGLGRSLFERLERAEHEVVMLTIQYRMHPEIRLFPSQYFYQNLLIDCQDITREVQAFQSNHSHHLSSNQKYRVVSPILLEHHIKPVMFVNIPHSHENRSGKSFINEMEANYIIQFLLLLVAKRIIFSKNTVTAGAGAVGGEGGESMTIAIITPYKAQVRNIQQKCLQNPILQAFFPSPSSSKNNNNSNSSSSSTPAVVATAAAATPSVPIIEINTVDGFQGREKDIVLMSTVRSNQSHLHQQQVAVNIPHGQGQGEPGGQRTSVVSRIGFVSDERRLNVAITRARKSLVIFGSKETLMVDSVWNEMITSLKNRNLIVSPQDMKLK